MRVFPQSKLLFMAVLFMGLRSDVTVILLPRGITPVKKE